MPYNTVRNVDRSRLIRAYTNNGDWRRLAMDLDVNLSTARSIIGIHQATGRTNSLSRGGNRPRALSPAMLNAVIAFVEYNPVATLNMMRQHLLQQFPDAQIPHVSTISRALDGQMITLKLVRPVPADWNLPVHKEARRQHAEWMLNVGVPQQNLIFLDEFGFTLWTARSQGRSPAGQRAVRLVNGQRGQHVSLCLAISPQWGLLHYEIVAGAFRNEHFQQFMIVLSTLLAGEQFTALVDGARAHGNLPAIADNHFIRHLPPYSPFINAAEYAGSCVKSEAKRLLSLPAVQRIACDSAAAANANLSLHAWRILLVREVVQDSMGVITQPKCLQWANHVASYYQRCLEYTDIFH